jgi:tRNA(adenine34) deaminase
MGAAETMDLSPSGIPDPPDDLDEEPLAHERFMRMALDEAAAAMREEEVPIGAVIVHRGRVVASAHNQREQLRDPTAHAEMIAITQASQSLHTWRLEECLLYATLEPCPMCAGAILQSRIPVVIYGAADPKAGAVHSLFRLLEDARLNHRATVIAGVLADRCGQILSEFFQRQRKLGKK